MKKKIEVIKQYRRKWYDSRAPIYDNVLVDENYQNEMRGFKKYVKVSKGDIILDIATGTGNYLIEMAKNNAICYGVDISSEMIKQAKRKIKVQNVEKNVKEIRIGKADKLPYTNNFFDFVTCIGMLEYYPIEYSKTVLNEINRVLKPNKRCFIDISNPNSRLAQSYEHTYKYHLKTFEEMVNTLKFKILVRNTVGTMIQYLLLKMNNCL